VIAPYNAQRDSCTSNYFRSDRKDHLRRTLKKTGQIYPGESTEGFVVDRFYVAGPSFQYLSQRNSYGAGHSREIIDGHTSFMSSLPSIVGYNGRFGYRRTNPWLRSKPSNFGLITLEPIH